jgi:hypothetical protein
MEIYHPTERDVSMLWDGRLSFFLAFDAKKKDSNLLQLSLIWRNFAWWAFRHSLSWTIHCYVTAQSMFFLFCSNFSFWKKRLEKIEEIHFGGTSSEWFNAIL